MQEIIVYSTLGIFLIVAAVGFTMENIRFYVWTRENMDNPPPFFSIFHPLFFLITPLFLSFGCFLIWAVVFATDRLPPIGDKWFPWQ